MQKEITIDPKLDNHILLSPYFITVLDGKVLLIKDSTEKHEWSSHCWCRPYLARNNACLDEGSLWIHRTK